MSSLADSPEIQAMRRFIAMTMEKREVDARSKELGYALKAMQPSLLAYLASVNMRAVHLDGHMLTPHREPWIYPVRGVSRQEVCEALKIAGLSRMVREDYSTASLTAHVKQLEERAQLITGLDAEEKDESTLEQLLHPALAKLLHVQAAFSLHVRKSKYDATTTNDDDEGAQNNDDES